MAVTTTRTMTTSAELTPDYSPVHGDQCAPSPNRHTWGPGRAPARSVARRASQRFVQRGGARIDLAVDGEELAVARGRGRVGRVACSDARHRLGGLAHGPVPARGGRGLHAGAEARGLGLTTGDDRLA